MMALRLYSTPSVRSIGEVEGVGGEAAVIGDIEPLGELEPGGVAGGESKDKLHIGVPICAETTIPLALGALLSGEEPPSVGTIGRLLEMIAGSMTVCPGTDVVA